MPAMTLDTPARQRRLARFMEYVSDLPRPVTILDIGGTNGFWEIGGLAGDLSYSITLVNTFEQEQVHPNIIPLMGDATQMGDLEDQSFDVAFSNSVIEHLFTYENQQAMAQEVRRIGRRLWVQTPNFWFPIEPHFRFFGWQWLPTPIRIAILQRRRCGWRGPMPDREHASARVREVRLLRKSEMGRLFPGAVLQPEWFYGLVKSWTAVSKK